MDRVLDEDAIRLWIAASVDALAVARAEIDALNVFPVPDGDTGTNLFLTVEAAGIAVAGCPAGDGLSAVAEALARGALLGARGNSGVILSQLLRAASDVVREAGDGSALDGDVVRRVLRRGEVLAYKAVAQPVEGTILTVARAAADAAEAAHSDDAAAVVTAAVDGAGAALARTPDMLDVLRDAGVVDAGGRGLVVVLDALRQVLTGVRRPLPAMPAVTRTAVIESSEGGPEFEVMYLLDAVDDDIDSLRDALGALGDSLVIVGGDGLWNIHVHVDDAGAAVEAALAIGRPHRIRITHLVARQSSRSDLRRVVVVTHGPGIASLLAESGCIVVPALPRQRPSTGEILQGIAAADADEVIVLPSDKDARAVAEAAAEEARASGCRVSVIPTRSVVQSLAAIAVHDAGARFDDDVVAMTRAASATHYAAVTVATKEALTTAGTCRPGDILGLADGDIVDVGSDLGAVACGLVDRLLATGGELVTMVTGCEIEKEEASRIEELVVRAHPTVDIQVIDGGQPLWPLIIGVE